MATVDTLAELATERAGLMDRVAAIDDAAAKLVLQMQAEAAQTVKTWDHVIQKPQVYRGRQVADRPQA